MVREGLFDDVDVIMCPTMVTVPPSGTNHFDADWKEYHGRVGAFTCPFNFSRNPTVSLPCGFSSNTLPISLQIVGKKFHEDTIISLGKVYQSATDWHTKNPSGFGFE